MSETGRWHCHVCGRDSELRVPLGCDFCVAKEIITPGAPETIVDAAGGIVRCAHRKVAIIGAGPSRDLAPWEDESYCWWMLNEIRQARFARHFELHPLRVQNGRELDWLAVCPTPCYVLDLEDAGRPRRYFPGTWHRWDEPVPVDARTGRPIFLDVDATEFPGVAHAVAYPLKRVLAATGGRRYFTCTFAFQIALAVAEGAEEIGVWGVDLDLGTLRERLVEKPCVEYWLGLAEGRGVRVTLPEGATLLTRPWLYGYEYDAEKAQIETVCADLVATLPKGQWPKGTIDRLTAAYFKRLDAREARATLPAEGGD